MLLFRLLLFRMLLLRMLLLRLLLLGLLLLGLLLLRLLLLRLLLFGLLLLGFLLPWMLRLSLQRGGHCLSELQLQLQRLVWRMQRLLWRSNHRPAARECARGGPASCQRPGKDGTQDRDGPHHGEFAREREPLGG